MIRDHATIGIVVTADGTVGEFDRSEYEEAEARVIAELTAIGKPFCIVLNSATPESESSAAIAYALEEKYRVPVALVNCLELDAEDIRAILSQVLSEFPVREIGISLPSWTLALDPDHRLRTALTAAIRKTAQEISRMGEIQAAFASLQAEEAVETVTVRDTDLGKGRADVAITLEEPLYYRTISELTGMDIPDETALIRTVRMLAETQKKYDRVADALEEVESTGYGIVLPEADDLQLGEPELLRQGSNYGVRLTANASSIHMIRADLATEINPIIGSEAQSEELIRYLQKEAENDPRKIWESNIFGKTLHELVNDGMQAKLDHMSGEARKKLSEALERVINEGSGGLICIIL